MLSFDAGAFISSRDINTICIFYATFEFVSTIFFPHVCSKCIAFRSIRPIMKMNQVALMQNKLSQQKKWEERVGEQL